MEAELGSSGPEGGSARAAIAGTKAPVSPGSGGGAAARAQCAVAAARRRSPPAIVAGQPLAEGASEGRRRPRRPGRAATCAGLGSTGRGEATAATLDAASNALRRRRRRPEAQHGARRLCPARAQEGRAGGSCHSSISQPWPQPGAP